MPKNSNVDVVRRLQALDRALVKGPVFLCEFARKWKVSEKTVRRDLKDLKKLGQNMMWDHDHNPATNRIGKRWWKYAEGQRPMFTSSLRGSG